VPESIGQLANLQSLDLGHNQLTVVPESIGQLANLQSLDLGQNQLTVVPESIGQLANLLELTVIFNELESLPESIGGSRNLKKLYAHHNQLMILPDSVRELANLNTLMIGDNRIISVPEWIGHLSNLQNLDLDGCRLTKLPEWVRRLNGLTILHLRNNKLTVVPEWIGQLDDLEVLFLENNELTSLPASLGRMKELQTLNVVDNPLNPALQSAYNSGLDALRSYLSSLEDPGQLEELYEAKLVLVGEGNVGKTTLLKAMTGQEPREDEPTTHGVSIDREAMYLPHPDKEGVKIRLNAWDFGGQEVYRVTHQFFYSQRSVYLIVWEPRIGVQGSQVEDWLKLIRLRVGADARVIIVSTHAKTGGRIARIDKPVFERDFGSMLFGFHEVDSLVDDPETGEKVGVAELKNLIAEAARDLPQMGMQYNRDWREARDELLEIQKPRIAYQDFVAVCGHHNLNAIAAKTLADQMDYLGYIVYYGEDDHLKDDIVLQPEWLTKAIGFVLEDRTTQERDGILPDNRLKDVWLDHPFKSEPRYESGLYPFFLRLMEKYDVSYRLEGGDASLVAQHVPQVRPPLPWFPEDEPKSGNRRIEMVCVMDEEPPGLVPWMIVRTHEYAYALEGDTRGSHLLHWQKGMFLQNKSHGQAMLELRDREFHIYAEAVWPEYFMDILSRIVEKVITDNWPGMKDRYRFTVPCRGKQNGAACDGRFNIASLRQFLEEGDDTYRCQECLTRQRIVELLYGFEQVDSREQLALMQAELSRDIERLHNDLVGLDSRMAGHVMNLMHAMANEAKNGPRLFTIEPIDGDWKQLFSKRLRLKLWCEAEGCQHPVLEEDKGNYQFEQTQEWVRRVAPYANFVAGMLKTAAQVALPAANAFLGEFRIDLSDVNRGLDLMQQATSELLRGDGGAFGRSSIRQGMLSEEERSGLLALHAFLREHDPTHRDLGLMRVPTQTGDFLWLCQEHYKLTQLKIPERIVF
jgi:Leucine-rich repeat (LRR) protein